MRSLDVYRPITIVTDNQFNDDLVVQYFDVISINRYYGWYSDAGQLDLITYQLINDVTAWYQRFNRPIIITEYGADTYTGLHQVQSFITIQNYSMRNIVTSLFNY